MKRPDFWIGTAPFCSAGAVDCKKTPGYEAVKFDKKGDGKKCWAGNKVLCRFNPESYKKEYGNVNSDFIWYGTAPWCSVNDCDVWKNNQIPVKKDKSGDGSYCYLGSKILGRNPKTEEEREMVRKEKLDCVEFEEKHPDGGIFGDLFKAGRDVENLASALGSFV